MFTFISQKTLLPLIVVSSLLPFSAVAGTNGPLTPITIIAPVEPPQPAQQAHLRLPTNIEKIIAHPYTSHGLAFVTTLLSLQGYQKNLTSLRDVVIGGGCVYVLHYLGFKAFSKFVENEMYD